ncbi:TetR/AcrR family transcriptional regulator [Mycobacterium sp. CBMA293]|nr:TetR/AcrR family transcriptional regulator [Mycolicibacterium sp. CBMA 360]MUL57610.1 TetR/AcrR family transcriptional regulator [Mycolicibacterium sp. CBMA 335]MUL70650.1 TetR/AcrR family transcriptional regulator [Mycolicibacterium sp. CBMA 311]MUL92698.1 TetR/AcrR family transcriptional regulator [Mycolicibacterium sp. CBMA 230]MUM12219.1 TetR/AcrR family transcriptional regulator [Mycolicibacterium sp. CBMA 293]MUM31235.1 TetR/AcrR family transcriptional regulator [Mycolicibacterium sp.
MSSMARYGAEHKNETRRRIIAAASRRLKQDGIDGSGIATVMSDANLTNGAFYAHFGSKNDLVANVVADQLEQQRAAVSALPADRESLESYIRSYLSTEHRDNQPDGCPTAALLSEIGRCDGVVRDAYSAGAQSIVKEIALHLPAVRPEVNRMQTAWGLFGILVTSLQLARAISDPEVSAQVLDAGINNALRILDSPE